MKPLSREFLLKRGFCCNNGCKNCPYKRRTDMSKLIDRCYVKESELDGYGVFADEQIKDGEVIMECVIPYELFVKNTYQMRGYKFAWREPGEDSYEEDFIPLGKACVVNCSSWQGIGDGNIPLKPNLKWSLNKAKRLMVGTACKDIDKDEEILWDYGFESQDMINLKPDPIS
tara:strand:+ start:137 stop:652 length:516 start_codon:yes stop_codon:yes gene_type:complete